MIGGLGTALDRGRESRVSMALPAARRSRAVRLRCGLKRVLSKVCYGIAAVGDKLMSCWVLDEIDYRHNPAG